MIAKWHGASCVPSAIHGHHTEGEDGRLEIALADIRAALGLTEPQNVPPVIASGWSIDSRTVEPGDLFFALQGENHDGHAYLESVFARGAVGAVVSRTVPADSSLFLVPDTLAALQQLARWARCRWGKPVVAVTGSAGKTTTKDAIAALLGERLRVGKTSGNLNNHIGLPLSLLRLPGDAEVGVFEMGMNHGGEIRFLAEIAKPDIGVVTNVGYAHIENFGSIEGIAAAKRELIESLPADGCAVLNADDARVLRFRDVYAGKAVTYGFSEGADVRATEVKLHADGSEFLVGGVRFRSLMQGRHGVLNILAALAVAAIFEIPPEALTDRVAQIVPGKMRGERLVRHDMIILNDCYNSNPDAARSMIDVLRDEPARRRVAVLGEMLELGSHSASLHHDLGSYAAQSGIDVVVGIRGAARHLVDAASESGTSGGTFFFDESEDAGRFLRTFLRPGDAVLFKGSRGTHVERALEAMEL
jgi:UDP-N-acetylmuramoyl-tripeptide--D-alanyl-D-alanine ligase